MRGARSQQRAIVSRAAAVWVAWGGGGPASGDLVPFGGTDMWASSSLSDQATPLIAMGMD